MLLICFLGDNEVVIISRWLACMYRSLDEFQNDETVLDELKAFKMLPLSDGELVSVNEKTVFFPIMKNMERQRSRGMSCSCVASYEKTPSH